MSVGFIVDAIAKNKANLARLRKRGFLGNKKVNHEEGKDVLNLKEPSSEDVNSNREEVKDYVKRRKVLNVVFWAVGIGLIVLLILKLN